MGGGWGGRGGGAGGAAGGGVGFGGGVPLQLSAVFCIHLVFPTDTNVHEPINVKLA